jgi:tRNA(fMet)-specific endonuclease VapC
MGLILDTSILIATERKRFDLTGFVATQPPSTSAGISTVTASEYLHGVERATAGRRRADRLEFFENLLGSFHVFAFDLETARTHAVLSARMAASGIVVGPHDLIIAATCLHHGWQLATLNETEFAMVPGLSMVPTAAFRR